MNRSRLISAPSSRKSTRSQASDGAKARQEVTPQQQRSRESHERIISAAERILTGPGMAEFSLPRVSEESGISIGGIYRRFQDKESLLLAVQRRVYQTMAADHLRLEALADASDAPFDAQIDLFVSGMAELLRRHAALIKAIVEASWSYPRIGRGGVQTYEEQCGRFVQRMLGRHRAAIRHPQPEHALAFCFDCIYELVASHFGFGRRIATDHSGWDTLVSDLQHLCVSYLTNAPVRTPARRARSTRRRLTA